MARQDNRSPQCHLIFVRLGHLYATGSAVVYFSDIGRYLFGEVVTIILIGGLHGIQICFGMRQMVIPYLVRELLCSRHKRLIGNGRQLSAGRWQDQLWRDCIVREGLLAAALGYRPISDTLEYVSSDVLVALGL